MDEEYWIDVEELEEVDGSVEMCVCVCVAARILMIFCVKVNLLIIKKHF